MTLTDRLMKLKESVDMAEKNYATSQGKLQSQEERLRKVFKCRSLNEAEKKIDELENRFKQIQIEIETEVEKLERELEN